MHDCRIILSGETNPFFNLALEEYLVRERRRLGVRWGLLLYRNTASVIVGRNQNPWIECAAPRLEAVGIPVARRISGGGAVYHDLGNGNFSVIGPRKEYRPARHAELLRQVLARLGVDARRDDHHSLFAEGCKISGSAFMLTGRTALQHATFLWDADLDQLRRTLTGGAPGISTRAQKSRPAEVANIMNMAPRATWSELCGLLVEKFRRDADRDVSVENFGRDEIGGDSRFGEYLARHESWEWRYGRTPEFSQERAGAFSWGTVKVELTVKRGRFFDVHFTGAPECLRDGLDALAVGLEGCRFDPVRVRKRVEGLRQCLSAGGSDFGEIGSWLEDDLFGGSGAATS